jgi:hypothetical protein
MGPVDITVWRDRVRRFAVAPLAIGLSACTVYDPRVGTRAAAPPGGPARVVRLCGEAREFEFAERVLAATGLFVRVKSCSEPFEVSDLQVRVRRPYLSGEPLAVSLLYGVLTVGVIPTISCQRDLGFQFYLPRSTVEVAPDRTTCALYGWLPPLLIPLPAFHFGQESNVQKAADALRNAILTEAPSVAEPAAPR